MTDSAAPRAHRSKAVAGALALFAGPLGAHRLYLGARGWWVYPLLSMPAMAIALAADPWYRHPGFFFAAAIALAAMLEAIVICLTPDVKWDATRNAGSGRRSASGWPAVLVAMASLVVGATLMMSVLAIALETVFSSMPRR